MLVHCCNARGYSSGRLAFATRDEVRGGVGEERARVAAWEW
jgi:hypothetical protein